MGLDSASEDARCVPAVSLSFGFLPRWLSRQFRVGSQILLGVRSLHAVAKGAGSGVGLLDPQLALPRPVPGFRPGAKGGRGGQGGLGACPGGYGV